MAHQTDIPYLNQDNVLYYLDLFAQDMLVQYGCSLYEFDMIIVGGAAIALKYGNRSTVDIDADMTFGGAVTRSIKTVAKNCSITTDWLNWDFIKSPSYSWRIRDDSVFLVQLQGFLNIRLVS